MQIFVLKICSIRLVFLVLLFLLLAPDAVSPPTAVSYPSALDVTWDPPVR